MNILLLLLLLYFICSFCNIKGECPNLCSGQGICTKYNTCICNNDVYGFDCSLRRCPTDMSWGKITDNETAHQEFTECSSRGICNRRTGLCQCQEGFEGNACQHLSCPRNCNSNGKCVSMREYTSNKVVAKEHHDGPPYTYGIWDADKIHGCICESPAMGFSCSLRSCPTGDDPLTTDQNDEIQLLLCTQYYTEQIIKLSYDGNTPPYLGSFVLKHGTLTTRPIPVDAPGDAANRTSISEYLRNILPSSNITATRVDIENAVKWNINFSFDPVLQSNYLRPKWKRSEIQTFMCAADSGSFMIKYRNDFVRALSNSSATDLQNILESFARIGNVNVTYSNGTVACNPYGNIITMTFIRMYDYESLNGDIPLLRFSSDGLYNTNSLINVWIDPVSKQIVPGIDECRVVEVQRILCIATGGKFKLSYNSTDITDIPSTISANDLSIKLMQAYSQDIAFLEVNYMNSSTACSKTGNIIQISFNFTKNDGPLNDGDIPTILVDKMNGGSNGLFHAISSNLYLPSAFTEFIKGLACAPIAPFEGDLKIQLKNDMDYGKIVLGFRGAYTIPINVYETSSMLKRILAPLSTINDVAIAFNGTDFCQYPPNIVTVKFLATHGRLPSLDIDTTIMRGIGASIIVASSGMKFDEYASIKGTKENDICSGRGSCHPEAFGICNCYQNQYSTSSIIMHDGTIVAIGDCGHVNDFVNSCPGEIKCSAHGTCLGAPTYKCSCMDGWTSGDCSERSCPLGKSWFDYPILSDQAHKTLEECSNVGSCDRVTGVCICSKPFTGAACELMMCSEDAAQCSGHGICVSLHQLAPITKINFEYLNLHYGSNPNDPNTWDANKIQSCLCDDGYIGYDCSQLQCISGDDPNTYDDVPEIQLFSCQSHNNLGSFRITFRSETTSEIPCTASASTVQSILETLSTISLINVKFSQDSNTSVCNNTMDNIVSITFIDGIGLIPPIKVDTSQLVWPYSFIIATKGENISNYTSQRGTREAAICSNHGICDYETGQCICEQGYGDSDGMGNLGDRKDCGYRIENK